MASSRRSDAREEAAGCPRCGRALLMVIYYDDKGQPVGGHRQCTECGSRHSEKLLISSGRPVQERLLERRAS